MYNVACPSFALLTQAGLSAVSFVALRSQKDAATIPARSYFLD